MSSASSQQQRPAAGRVRINAPHFPARSPADTDAASFAEADFDANARLAYLEAAVNDWPAERTLHDPAPPETDEPDNLPTTSPNLKSRRSLRPLALVKSGIAVAIAVALGWLPVQRLLATTSAEAVVNARIITVRAPIEGEVTMSFAGTEIGTTFHVDQDILTISNPRADSSHLNNLVREREQLRTNMAALEAKKKLLLSSLGDLDTQQERFRLGRIEQIEQRAREADADIASAQAQYSVAEQALKRASSLRTTDAVSQAFLDKAEGDAHVTQQAILAQMERKKGILVELTAARNGTYVGDSYNDTPQSAQRKMEVSLELSDVDARLAGSRSELAALEDVIAKEQGRHADLSRVDIRSTVNGRVWEMLTAPGEHVNAGQDLMKVLDCGSAIVTASVSETAYQRLSVGQAASFEPRDGGPEVQGTIIALNGLTAVESNTAIQQNALTREPYHVSLKFPELSKNFDCRVGRSGLVKFDTSSGAMAAAAF